jgi:ectoine hydroxylase-related dioxygenase (phytanoyl-CoA dioxygenase family)
MSRPQPLTDHERYFFDLYGYLIRHDSLSPTELAEANAAVDRLQLPRPGNEIESQRFTGYLDGDEIFRDLLDHEAILEPILEMCGPRARLDHAYGITMAPGTRGLGLHGGATPHDPAQFYDVRDGRIYNGLVAVQWALVDHPGAGGGFRCIPGSHRANFARPAEVPPSWVVDVPLQAGDVVLFTEALTHGTAPWLADYDRRALLYKYSPGHSSWSFQHTTTLAEWAQSPKFSERQRRLLQPPSVSQHLSVRG